MYVSKYEVVIYLKLSFSQATKLDTPYFICRDLSGCNATQYNSISVILILSTYECLLVFLVVLQVSLLRLIKYI